MPPNVIARSFLFMVTCSDHIFKTSDYVQMESFIIALKHTPRKYRDHLGRDHQKQPGGCDCRPLREADSIRSSAIFRAPGCQNGGELRYRQ